VTHEARETARAQRIVTTRRDDDETRSREFENFTAEDDDTHFAIKAVRWTKRVSRSQRGAAKRAVR
jgi:hypothetical protein